MAQDVVLFSGGMDSLIAWEYLGRPDRLYAKLGHRYEKEELKRIKELDLPGIMLVSGVLQLGSFEKEDAEIPLRNLYLSMLAVNLGYSKIWLVVQQDEMMIADRTSNFLFKTSSLLSQVSGRVITVSTPFEYMDKSEMVAWYVDSGKDVEILKRTWACYTPKDGEPCGNCGACFRRYVAFKENDLDVDYKLTQNIKDYYSARLDRYSLKRQKHMEKWV